MKPGRRSAAELAVGPIIPGARPPPPADLEPVEQATWTAITASLPTDWFTPCNLPMLKELCRHIHYADLLAREITRLRKLEGDAKTEAALRDELRAHSLQSERIANLSTKLKLTQRSRYARADAAYSASKDAGPYPKPWTDWGSGRQ
jgi:hypothetical protein